MHKTQYKSFIEFLDSYQKKQKLSYSNAFHLQNIIQTNYLKQYHMYHSNPEFPTNELKMKDLSTSFFNNEIKQSTFLYNYDISDNDTYHLWQKEHEITIPSLEIVNSMIVPNIHKEIDFELESLDDILELLNKYPYENNVTYNIDLKSLHNIREELELLNNMIGMKNIKKSILDQIIYFIQDLHLTDNHSDLYKSKTKIKQEDYKHTVLMGPPGTVKTEMAKIIGKMYSKLGILKNNVFKKVTRNDLVAGYLGQTALKTKKVIDECLGGVLFIDEAYSLGTDDSYSKECIDILCESLSDHKHDLMVIIAGYENELNNTFFRINPGMRSRFIWKFTVDSYSPRELMLIFEKHVKDCDWSFADDYLELHESTAKNIMTNTQWFIKHKDNFKHFGRDMELLFSYVKIAHAKRIYGKNTNLRKKISKLDLEKGYETFSENKKQSNSDISRILNSGMYV